MKAAPLPAKPRTLVVIPTDPIEAYEKAGYDYLERYYNPCGWFQKVFAISPRETRRRHAWGMEILPTTHLGYLRKLHHLKPDVVRAYGGYWASDLACGLRYPGIPVVVSVHDSDPSCFSESLRFASQVWCVSKIASQRAIEKGVAPDRIRLLPNRVDLQVFHPRHDPEAYSRILGFPPQGHLILHVGRMVHQKNIDTLLRAMVCLPKDYSVLFVGRGDSEPYRNLAEELGVSQRCHWKESIKNADLPILFSHCSCMCTPSRHEGFGIVFIEAAACGAAVITSNIAPMNEYLTHHKNAWLIDEFENHQSLAQGIRKVCENPLLESRLRESAIQIGQRFSRARIDALEKTYYSAILEDKISKEYRLIELLRNHFWFARKMFTAKVTALAEKETK